MKQSDNLVWLDLEMTGLDPEVDTILEIATVITDSELNFLDQGPVIAIHQDASFVDSLDDWNLKHHGESGLIDRCIASEYSVEQAEQETLKFVKKYIGERTSPLCGNSIGQDRRFLVKYMNEFNEFLHYRNIDVSTLKELIRRWYPDLPSMEKKNLHTALDDIMESVEELKYYRKHIFVSEL